MSAFLKWPIFFIFPQETCQDDMRLILLKKKKTNVLGEDPSTSDLVNNGPEASTVGSEKKINTLIKRQRGNGRPISRKQNMADVSIFLEQNRNGK